MTKIEQVALAIWDADDPETRTLDDDPKYREQARAAIEAMREPTEKMVMAGEAGIDSDCQLECNHKTSWRAMIDAALAEK